MPKTLERIREVSPLEMSQILDECVNTFGLGMIRYGVGCEFLTKKAAMKSHRYHSLATQFLICETPATLEITTIFHVNEKQRKFLPTTWVCSLNNIRINTVGGLTAYMQFQRAAHVPTLEELGIHHLVPWDDHRETYAYSASPLIGSKTPKISSYSNVYEYDINSAYANVLLQGVPLFNEIDYNRVVGKGEIGFYLNEALTLAHEGMEADLIVKLVPCPVALKNYIYKWYNEKRLGNVSAKSMLNFPIGYAQRKNPLFRAYVVHTCNELIYSLIDNDTVLWNTDAVYSLRELDLPLGDNIGEWKKVIIPELTTLGCNYQIGKELPVYRGIPKYWFESFAKEHGRPFDLTKDTLPDRINKWTMNWKTLKLEVTYG